MTYTPPDGSREEALIRNLRAGIPMLRARFAAGFKTMRSLPEAIEVTPGLAEAIGEAEAEAERKSAEARKEAGDANDRRDERDRPVRSDLAVATGAGVRATGATGAPLDGGRPTGARAGDLGNVRGGAQAGLAAVAPDASGGAASNAPLPLVDLARTILLDLGNDVAPAPPVTRSKRASEATDDGAPDWERIREEAAEMAPGVMGWILYQEKRLADADAGFPALSPFSLRTIEDFFLSGKRWLLWMAGRGFGKSTLTGRIASAIGFGVERRAAPGPAWVCPIVSVLPVDADRRLEDIQQILLHAYLQEVKPAKSMIAARDQGFNALAWVSSASTLGNVSGPSSFAALVDEEEKILYGRAGAIVGSLAFTFRSRPRVYGMRVSSAMTMDGTLARACAKGNGPGAPLTNFVATLGPFVDDAVAGVIAVAAWEESRGNAVAATALRAHALTLTPDSWQIPTWLGHPSIGNPDERLLWAAGDAAVATRIEAEAVDEKMLDGLSPWRYWLRECASVPTSDEMEHDEFDGWEIMGEAHRNADVRDEETYDHR